MIDPSHRATVIDLLTKEEYAKASGLADLIILMTFMCFFIGCVQTLMIPMVLPIYSVKTVGFMELVSAIGMVLGSRKSIRKIEVVNKGEIGTMKAIGMSYKDIRKMLTVEILQEKSLSILQVKHLQLKMKLRFQSLI